VRDRQSGGIDAEIHGRLDHVGNAVLDVVERGGVDGEDAPAGRPDIDQPAGIDCEKACAPAI
jgi:hypothetical protein